MLGPVSNRLKPGTKMGSCYNACYIILNYNIYLTSEQSAPPTSGQADFHIASVDWTIECVRDGDRLEKRIARFSEGGKYHGAIISGQTKQ